MLPSKAQKIDLGVAYPCPCCRRGQLVPIALTDALGCKRCQQFFLIEEDGYTVTSVTHHYQAYKQAWYWAGEQWHRIYPQLRGHLAPSLSLLLVFLLLVLFLSFLPTQGMSPIALIAVLVSGVVFLALLVWLAYRQ